MMRWKTWKLLRLHRCLRTRPSSSLWTNVFRNDNSLKCVASLLIVGLSDSRIRCEKVIDVQEPTDSERPLSNSTPLLRFDPEWLAITRAFHRYMSTSRSQPVYPDEAAARTAVAEELNWVKENIVSGGVPRLVSDCQKFTMTAPAPGSEGADKKQQREYL